MTKWPYSKITDHKDKALERFTEQYVDAENLKNLVKISADRIQLLEEAIWDLLTKRSVENSEGRQLDLLGEIFGERRLARNDEDFRNGILLRITLNRSGGDPETILSFLRSLTTTQTIVFKENFPASIEIFIGENVDPFLISRIRSLVSVGIGSIFVSSIDGEKAFGLRESTITPPEDIDGFGELLFFSFDDFLLSDESLLELSTGETLGVREENTAIEIFENAGGELAELQGF